MINFFRKIRQNLLSEGKTAKYIKYATGEIVLVVIGILIALQINNWNEGRKLNQEELRLLSEVKSNLETTLINFSRDTLLNTASITKMRKIEHYVNNDLPYSSELDEAFATFGQWQSPYPITTAYSTLKTKGLDNITNKQLRNRIANMYEFEFVVLHNDYDKGEWGIIQNANVFLNKHIRSKNSKQTARPNDFEELKKQLEFSNILSKIIAQRETGLKLYRETIIAIAGLIKELEYELNSRI
ncbi:DUF6090 family protein [Leeuwenhoekiella nanhaiensis]|uniref:Uncharacterized protein n=1 Tax=Leeuwenhoekiella nanhaiensis TaxID=1655491 RepID=A0A2G1VPP4_9FLAO|nr:DUF6090 family protein [Leeuwenhoekiella nanhaiensis]PHQ28449.1 hypothetical protein CJ305_15160 [Leeuwenhoekiella nanhaiensis]